MAIEIYWEQPPSPTTFAQLEIGDAFCFSFNAGDSPEVFFKLGKDSIYRINGLPEVFSDIDRTVHLFEVRMGVRLR